MANPSKFEVEVTVALSDDERERLWRMIENRSVSQVLHGIAFVCMEHFNEEQDLKARAVWLNQAAAVHSLARLLDP